MLVPDIPQGMLGDDMKITHKDHVGVMSQISKKIKQHTRTLSMRKSRRSGDLIVLINMVHFVCGFIFVLIFVFPESRTEQHLGCSDVSEVRVAKSKTLPTVAW